MPYVYILRSLKDGSYYKGFTEDFKRRLIEHNAGLSKYTAQKVPWELVYVEEFANKREALIREKKLKSCKADYFEWLTTQNSNVLLR